VGRDSRSRTRGTNEGGRRGDAADPAFDAAVVLVLGIAGTAFFVVMQQTGGGGLPPPPTYSWHVVTSFSGSTDKTTDSFLTTGSKFRLNWSATAENEFGLLSVFIYEVGHTVWADSLLATWDAAGEKSDSTVVFENGTFYLDIGAANLVTWSIIVEEWR
jgi:hypothetical protein